MMRADAPAKVNLALGVVGRRPDGYHALVSLFARLDLADRLTVERVPGDADRLVVAGPIDYRPGPDDLILRAAAVARDALAPGAPALAFRLEKRIPLAAGLGGGSADAAAALDLVARAWGVEIGDAQRLELASRLGSDVPFLVSGAVTALVTGRGEYVRPLPGPSDPVGLLLVTVGSELATRDVFAAQAELQDGPDAPRRAAASLAAPAALPASERAEALADRLAAGWTAAELCQQAAVLRDANDLWAPAVRLRPDLGVVRDALETRLGRPVLLSGSGPTLFALYPSRTAAESGAEAIRDQPVGGVAAEAVRVAAIPAAR